jgi:hypothetical protein
MPDAAMNVSQKDALVAMMARAKRSAVPIRHTFIQQGRGKVRTPGPLSALCQNRDEDALDLYLIFHMISAGRDPGTGEFSTTVDASGWARAMGLHPTTNNLAKVSKVFARLERHGLIARGRSGNRGRYTLLDEGGHGGAYEHPGGAGYFLKLPHDYWINGWHQTLDLTSKVLLLISLSLKEDFVLPRTQGPAWYGLSPATIQAGLATLKSHQVLTERVELKPAPLTDAGITRESHYTLAGDFELPARQKPKIVRIRKAAS